MIMTVITIVFYLLFLAALVAIYFKMSELKQQEPIVPKVDVTLSSVNYFIRREVLFDFISWFNSKIAVKHMGNPNQSSTLIGELKDPDIIQKKMQVLTMKILATMSPSLKYQFYSVYDKRAYDDPDSMLSSYISRQIMFYIRRANVDITAMFTNNPEDSTDKLLKLYIISLENEIYKNNNIDILSNSDNFAEENEGAQE